MPIINNESFNPDFSRLLDIESLISAPLVAVSKANVVMAQGQTRFLLEYCFNKIGDAYEPVLIQMALVKSVAVPATATAPQSVQTVTSYFNLPLLTIVPFNSLMVNKMNIAFNMEISGIIAKPSSTANESDNKITDKKAQLYGKISDSPEDEKTNKKSGDKNRSANKIKMNLNAATLPLPKGVLTIIDLYTKAIQVAGPDDPGTTN